MVFSVLLAVVTGEVIFPNPWPTTFTISFASNLTTDTPFAGGVPTHNVMYYDWDLKMQRVDHGKGSYECAKFYQSDEACTIWFTPDGLWRNLQAPLPDNQPQCCLDMPEIKASPPGWAMNTDPLPTWLDTNIDSYSNIKSNHWSFITNDPNPTRSPHEYKQVNDGSNMDGRPLVFTFPVDNGNQDYHFDPKSLEMTKPDSSLFELPNSCRQNDGSPVMCPQPN